MKILFDLLSAQPSEGFKFHGGGEYSKAIFSRLLELNDVAQIEVFYDKKVFLDEWICNLISEKKIRVYDVANYHSLCSIIDQEKPTVVYFPIALKSLSLIPKNSALQIGTIHDMRTLELKADKYALRIYQGSSLYKAVIKYLLGPMFLCLQRFRYGRKISSLDTVITVSNYSRESIRKFFKTGLGDIITCYSARKHKETSNKDCTDYLKLHLHKFVLLLGLDRAEKNPYRAIQAIEELLDLHELDGYKIVCTGNPSKYVKALMKHRDRYLVLGYVSSECLENLYAHCDVFLYPSLNEGFGYPPIEAMAYGRTCAVSATSSIPEVCGHVVHYFNPLDVHSIADGILRAVKEKIDPRLIKEHLDKINKRQDEDLDKLCHLILSGGKSLG